MLSGRGLYHVIPNLLVKQKMKVFTNCFKTGYNRPLRELKEIKGIQHIHRPCLWSSRNTSKGNPWQTGRPELVILKSCHADCLTTACLLDENTTASAKVSIPAGKATGKAYCALVKTTLPLKSVLLKIREVALIEDLKCEYSKMIFISLCTVGCVITNVIWNCLTL